MIGSCERAAQKGATPLRNAPAGTLSRLRKDPEFVIPKGVCDVRNLSFSGILIEEGFIAQKACDAKPYLVSLGMTAKSVFQQPVSTTVS